jgi:hypothetical protein
MPIGLFKTMNSIRLHPSARHGLSRFEKYREAWCLMACPKDGQCRSELQILRCCEREGAELRCPKGP